MENNIPRYKGNDNVMQFLSQNPMTPFESSHNMNEYSNLDNSFIYSSTASTAYQQSMPPTPYRINKEMLKNFNDGGGHSSYAAGSYAMYEQHPNNYNLYNAMHSYHGPFTNLNSQLPSVPYNSDGSYVINQPPLTDPKTLSSTYSLSMPPQVKNVPPSNYVRSVTDLSTSNYYQDMMYHNYVANQQNYNISSSMSTISADSPQIKLRNPPSSSPPPNQQYLLRSPASFQYRFLSSNVNTNDALSTSVPPPDSLKFAMLSVAKNKSKSTNITSTASAAASLQPRNNSEHRADAVNKFPPSTTFKLTNGPPPSSSLLPPPPPPPSHHYHHHHHSPSRFVPSSSPATAITTPASNSNLGGVDYQMNSVEFPALCINAKQSSAPLPPLSPRSSSNTMGSSVSTLPPPPPSSTCLSQTFSKSAYNNSVDETISFLKKSPLSLVPMNNSYATSGSSNTITTSTSITTTTTTAADVAINSAPYTSCKGTTNAQNFSNIHKFITDYSSCASLKSSSATITTVAANSSNSPSSSYNKFGLVELTKVQNRKLFPGCKLPCFKAAAFDLETSENLLYLRSFLSPVNQANTRCCDVDYPVPYEYLIYQSIKERISKFDCQKLNDELLFYVYYTEDNDCTKLAASANLYIRNWRYHTTNCVWIKCLKNFSPGESYQVFDPCRWEIIVTDASIDLSKLEDNSYSEYLNYEAPVVIAQNNLISNENVSKTPIPPVSSPQLPRQTDVGK